MNYGKELIVDIHNCQVERFTRRLLKTFFVELCTLINMEREDVHYWDYEGDKEAYDNAPEHLKGVSAVQFIKTSNITIHGLDDMKRVYVNIFSCKDFSTGDVLDMCIKHFKGKIVNRKTVERI